MSRLLLVVALLALGSLVTAQESEFEGAPCSFQSFSGTCTSGPCQGGHKITGKCQGPAEVQCCMYEEEAPPAPYVRATPSVGEGTSCTSLSGAKGTCLSTSRTCSGVRHAGRCPGLAVTITCCVPGAGLSANLAANMRDMPILAGPSNPTANPNWINQNLNKPGGKSGAAVMRPGSAVKDGGKKGPEFMGPAGGETGEGQVCMWQALKGTCVEKSAPCSGMRVGGKCPGAATVRCCVPLPKLTATQTVKSWPALLGLPLNTKFTYTFPYSTKRHIVADLGAQRIRLYDGAVALKEWKTSTGVSGLNFKEDSGGTPFGKLLVVKKVGYEQPLGMIFEALTPMKVLGKESHPHAYMQTRILQLDGQDEYNRNSMARGVMVHGTNRESKLGTMASHGCFRMANKDVIELFNAVPTGTELFSVPNTAWPATSKPTGVIPNPTQYQFPTTNTPTATQSTATPAQAKSPAGVTPNPTQLKAPQLKAPK